MIQKESEKSSEASELSAVYEDLRNDAKLLIADLTRRVVEKKPVNIERWPSTHADT